MPAIRTRAQWGARRADGAGSAPLPATGGVSLHHSVTALRNGDAAIRDLEDIGHRRFGAGISYTFPITIDGTVYEGHTIRRRGTHTGDHNSTVRAIVLVGNYDDHDRDGEVDIDEVEPSAAQLESAAQLLAHGHRHSWWPLRLRPHSEFKATACPGAHARAAIPGVVARAEALVAGGAPVTPTGPATRTILRLGDTGDDVEFLQAMLNIISTAVPLGDRRPLAVAGDYGRRTTARVLEFERWSNAMSRLAGQRTGLLQEDGIATQPTMAAVAFWVPVALQS